MSNTSKSPFAFLSAAQIYNAGLSADELTLAQSFWRSLPPDEYLPAKFGKRFRQHGQVEYSSNAQPTKVVNAPDYMQSMEVNPVAGDVVRSFDPVPTAFFDTLFFKKISELFLRNACVAFSGKFLLNLHLVRIVADLKTPGVPCPEGIHRDGFDSIFVMVIDRQNISGDVSAIYDDEGNLLGERQLQCPLDTLLADDKLVKHYTSDFHVVDNNNIGWRDTLLMSLSTLQ